MKWKPKDTIKQEDRSSPLYGLILEIIKFSYKDPKTGDRYFCRALNSVHTITIGDVGNWRNLDNWILQTGDPTFTPGTLVVSKQDSFIVEVTESVDDELFAGTVIDNGLSHYSIGEMRPDWFKECFILVKTQETEDTGQKTCICMVGISRYCKAEAHG